PCRRSRSVSARGMPSRARCRAGRPAGRRHTCARGRTAAAVGRGHASVGASQAYPNSLRRNRPRAQPTARCGLLRSRSYPYLCFVSRYGVFTVTSLRLIPMEDTVVFPGMGVTMTVDVGDDERVVLVPHHESEYLEVGVVAEVSERMRL